MARLSIILVFMIWLSWVAPTQAPHVRFDQFTAPMGGLLIGILCIGLYSRITARRLSGIHLHRAIYRFSRIMQIARIAVPAWYALLVFWLDYPVFVHELLDPLRHWPLESPAFLLGTLPPLIAMVGLIWAAYPAEQAIREQNLLSLLEANVPIHRGPTLLQYLVANVRLQLLFMYAPVLCIVALRDVYATTLDHFGVPINQGAQLAISLGAMLPVMLTSPILLVRILPTQRLPEIPLRTRLEALCRKNGLRVSSILLWRTSSNLGNAAVMGVHPRIRYLLITDLLLETMRDEHIIAVFAHEIGHIMHRHLLWMTACAFAIIFTIAGPLESGVRLLQDHFGLAELHASLLGLALSGPLFIGVFGAVVRRLERQADVFAARSFPDLADLQPDRISGQSPKTVLAPGRDFVTSHGAELVCSALKRVAAVNNVPIHAHEWLHGSIGSRIAFLRSISDDPHHTWQFDKYIDRMKILIAIYLTAMGAWTLWNVFSA